MTAIVVIPTYDEFENLPVVLARTLRAAPDAHVLVVDDDSPDGTGLLVAELAATTRGSTCCTASGSRGSARRTWPGSPGRSIATTT